jgi:hypothetical protein
MQFTGKYTLHLWMDTTTVHLSINGAHLKMLPSRLTSTDLARLRRLGARPAGPPPARPAPGHLAAGVPVEVHRTVNHVGCVSSAGSRRLTDPDPGWTDPA